MTLNLFELYVSELAINTDVEFKEDESDPSGIYLCKSYIITLHYFVYIVRQNKFNL